MRMNLSVNSSEELKFIDFKDSYLFGQSFSMMDKFRVQRQLCDVILKVEDQSFSVHRNILASISPYFLTMFTNDNFPESQMKEITMQGIEPSALEKLIEFAYRGEVRIDCQNVQSLMVAASLLLLDGVRDACVKFLVTQLNPTDVLGTRSFAESMNSTILVAAANDYIYQNFSEVAMSTEFLELDFKDLTEIIEHNDLIVNSEATTYEASMRWIKANQEERVPLLPQVLSKVRLSLLSPQYLLDRVSKEYLIRWSLDCRELVDEAKDYHLLQLRKEHLEFSRARHGKIYVVGGEKVDNASKKSVEIYDPVKRKWQMGKKMIMGRTYHVGAALMGKLYIFGGLDVAATLSTVEVFDPKINNWSRGREMVSKRKNAAVAVLDNLIYICGGYNERALNTVECFCPTTDTWKTVASMLKGRSRGAAATLGGHIYVAGGGGSCISVEKYDPAENSWVLVEPMIVERSEFGLTPLNGKLYACGGKDKDGYLQSAEVFDPAEEVWKLISPMNCKRRGLALVENMGKLWAIGGWDDESELSSVEVYDPATDKWSFVSSMNLPRTNFTAAVITN